MNTRCLETTTCHVPQEATANLVSFRSMLDVANEHIPALGGIVQVLRHRTGLAALVCVEAQDWAQGQRGGGRVGAVEETGKAGASQRGQG